MSLIINPYRYPPPAGGGTALEDTFEGAGSITALTAWTPTVAGTGWTQDPLANASVVANVQTSGVVQPSAGEANVHLAYFSNPDPSSADHSVEVEVGAVSGNDDQMHLIVRRQTDGACYTAAIRPGAGNIHLLRMTAPASVAAQLGSASKIVGAGDRVKLKAVGSTISVDFKDGAGAWQENVISVTDANIPANGKAGVAWGGYRTSSGDISTGDRFGYAKVAAP